MASMESYSKAAMERAMKVQEVILRAMAKKITWWQAAEILGISDRQMRRWHERLEEFGYDGLFDRRRGWPSPKRVPLALADQVLGLYRDRYFDLNVKHFHEKLVEQHGIQLSYTRVKQALQRAGLVAKGRKRGVHRKKQAAFDWMRKVVQGKSTPDKQAEEIGERSELDELLQAVTEGRLSVRNRALVILAHDHGVSSRTVCDFLHISKETAAKYCRSYRLGGWKSLIASKRKGNAKFDKDSNKQAVFSLLHSPPSAQGFNRTTWRMVDLQDVLRKQGQPMSKNVIHRIIKEAGYKWRRARLVLTSRDPEYRAKVDAIQQILSELGQRDAFFSIDEYGPSAVKQKGGIKRVARGENYVVPQWQKSKGWMILTAALELSRNQVTHFYSWKKNTDEMIKMVDTLRAQYASCSTIYLSWDAASWHISKKLGAHLEQLNQQATRDDCPVVKTAPLPAGAQFLNVIESVFSGMAKAIMHNSDYPSVEAARDAIDRYFAERNQHFSQHPKRAGNKIWGKERVPSKFQEGQNCKDPLYQ